MMRIAVSSLCLWLTAAATIWGCGGSNREAPKIPLDHGNPASTVKGGLTTPSGIGGEAKTALDSGNLLFRAKAYDRALVQYRRSGTLAPNALAPLFGILMVTDVTKDARLADSARSRMRELDPAAADSSAAMSHAQIVHAHSHAPKAPPVPRA
ncbi:MAG TPA: hypothetical protein VF836_04315 [Gemmatimonadaceae bacterium]